MHCYRNEFCITFGILCERLNYNKIALKYYLKALNYCFSKFVYYRVIKILLKQKDYKNCVLFLNKFLLYFHPKEFYNLNKEQRKTGIQSAPSARKNTKVQRVKSTEMMSQ